MDKSAEIISLARVGAYAARGAAPGSSPQETCAVYALTRIYCTGYIWGVQSVFDVIAEPNRRAILGLLAASEQSVGEIERQLQMPQPTVSKHLRVLREAGFVESTVDAQRRLYRLRPEPLQEVDAWLEPFRRYWSAHIDALERHLDRMARPEPRQQRKAGNRVAGPAEPGAESHQTERHEEIP